MSVKFFHIMLLVKDGCNPSISNCKSENLLIEMNLLHSKVLVSIRVFSSDLKTELKPFQEKRFIPEALGRRSSC